VPKTANLYNGSPSITDGQRWDSWGRFTSYLFATVPHQSINGASGASRMRMSAREACFSSTSIMLPLTLRL